MHRHTHTHTHVHTHAHMHACRHTKTCEDTHTYTHMHTHTPPPVFNSIIVFFLSQIATYRSRPAINALQRRSIRGELNKHYYWPFAAFTLRPIEGAPETQPARPAISRIGKTYALLEELRGSQSTPCFQDINRRGPGKSGKWWRWKWRWKWK